MEKDYVQCGNTSWERNLVGDYYRTCANLYRWQKSQLQITMRKLQSHIFLEWDLAAKMATRTHYERFKDNVCVCEHRWNVIS